MALVMGVISSIGPKLLELLKDEYKLEKGLKKKVQSLSIELESTHAALRKVAEVPWEQLDEHVQIWAREVREASYDMEGVLDMFLVRVEGHGAPKKGRLECALQKMSGLFSFRKCKARHDIAGTIEDIKKQLQEVTERRARYKVDDIVAKPVATISTVDFRIRAMSIKMSQLIGINKSRNGIRSMLQVDDVPNRDSLKMVSIFGIGGLGKTTLAKASYDNLRSSYDCSAFVSVGRNPNFVKVLKDILYYLDKTNYENIHNTGRDVHMLIRELQEFIENKRYFIVIDDIWEPDVLKAVKLALVENNCGSRIIITTRKYEVAKEAGEVYRLQPLSFAESRRLFYTRLFGGEEKCPSNHPEELSHNILMKCRGVPLAIITMASLLLGKTKQEWFEVCISPGFYRIKDDREVENTKHILALSYYDLPSHLKPCLLYLSVFPQGCVIEKASLVWKWIAEGFVEQEQGRGFFEVGEEYFHDLINRSLIQEVGLFDNLLFAKYHAFEPDYTTYGCHIHDMVFDLILSKSHEENFVTDGAGTLSENRARRLALKYRALDLTCQNINMDLPKVRSFIAFGCGIDNLAFHPRFELLRVLNLERCKFREGRGALKHLGNLLHLRYLGLRDLYGNCELPQEIRALKFLQTLDLRINYGTMKELPSSIGMLTGLVCLRAWTMCVPDGIIGKLTSLEELQIDRNDNDESKRQFMKDIGNLRELRVLRTRIDGVDESMKSDLLKSLGNIRKIQHLTLEDRYTKRKFEFRARHVRHMLLLNICFPVVPSCTGYSQFSGLSHMEINVPAMDEEGMKILGELPELRYLNLSLWSTITLSNISSDRYFQKLRSFELPFSMVYFLVNEDSSVTFTIWNGRDDMAFGTKKNDDFIVAPAIIPNLQELQFLFPVTRLIESNSRFCGNLGLDCLTSLEKIKIIVWCGGAILDDRKKVDNALRHEIEVHPNQPALQMIYYSSDCWEV